MRTFGMDQRGGNPVKAVIVLLSSFVIFFMLLVYFTEPLVEIWDATEEASTNPNTPDVWTGLWNAWLLIPMMILILLGIWFIAYLHSREREVEVFLR